MNLRRWLLSRHVRPIALLASGSAFAQILGLLAAPLITRLYLPSDYGQLAVYSSIVAIVATVAGGRYESAVALPSETEDGERDALALVWLSLALGVATSAAALAVVGVASAKGSFPALDALGSWAYAVPVGILATAWSLTLSAYATRQREYGVLARIAPLQKALSVGIQLAGGYMKLGLSGLMIGALATPFVGLGLLTRTFQTGKRGTPSSELAGRRQLWTVARKYSDFPRINMWFALLNALAWNIQAIILTRFYSISDVGQYALATAMISLPTGLVLTGVSQVYLRESAARAADSAAGMRLARQTLKALILASLPLFLILFVASKYLVTLIFGSGWETAGAIAVAMIPLAWARFLTTSLTATFTVYRRQGRLLLWQVIALAATVAALGLGGASGQSVVITTLMVSLAGAPLYLILLPMVFRLLRRDV